MSLILDADSPNVNNKVLDEQETRRRLLTHAKLAGCEKDMLLLFAKADKLLKNCSNLKEREDIGKICVVEIYKLLGGGGQLFINGQIVCDDLDK